MNESGLLLALYGLLISIWPIAFLFGVGAVVGCLIVAVAFVVNPVAKE